MTVGELREALANMQDDWDVVVYDASGKMCCPLNAAACRHRDGLYKFFLDCEPDEEPDDDGE